MTPSSALMTFFPASSEMQMTADWCFAGHCPLCDAARPMFVVYPSTGTFYCFACAAAGDVFSFVMRTHGVGFRAAVDIVRVAMLGTS